MRVTNSMISNSVLFNTQRSLARFFELESKMSTGRQINKPSDDPIGILRDLDYRGTLSQIEQFLGNIGTADNWVRTTEDVIYELNQAASTAKDLAVSMANDSISTEARTATASQIQQAIDSIIQLGNTQIEGRYLFSGFATDIPTLSRGSNGVVFQGDEGSIKYNIESGIAMGVNTTGNHIFLEQFSILGENSDLNVGVTGTTLLADLHDGSGISLAPGQFTIEDVNRGITANIDISGAVTVDDALTLINNGLTANGITNLNAVISEVNNSIQFNVTDDGLISNNTLIENLFDSNGLNLDPGVINISDGAAIDLNVDLSSETTIGEMITAFNSQLATAGIANVQMVINGTSTGLDIVDSNGTPLNLAISDTTGGNLATTLGLQGSVNPTLFGVDLSPKAHFNVTEAGGTTAEDLGILAEFKSDYLGNDINPLLTTNSAFTDLSNGLGLPGGILDIWHGDTNVQIDLSDPAIVTIQDFINAISLTGLDIEASINAAGTGIQIVNNDPFRSLTIEDGGDIPVAKQLGVYGSPDMVGSFFVLSNALENDDREAVGMLIENFDEIINNLLSKVAVTGSKAIRLEETKNRLMSQELIFTERLSEVEDADMTKLITNLSTYETNYQAALLAAAKIIQPSLLDFLR